jgi:AcrR family transcriptional regulator
MSPRKPAVLRDGGDQTLREHLIATAARLIDEQGTSGLTVRTIAREAKVADGVLYNHFADKEEVIALALRAHVQAVMREAGGLPRAGEATVEQNLRTHITRGLAVLARIMPAFAGVFGQPKVLHRFHELALDGGIGPHGEHALPARLAAYLREEQRLGRISATANVEATATLIIGACHEVALPRLFGGTPTPEVNIPPGFVDGLIATVLHGILPTVPE